VLLRLHRLFVSPALRALLSSARVVGKGREGGCEDVECG